ncbi:ribosome bioproteinsis protein ytm1 [Saitoella coloradoensis]
MTAAGELPQAIAQAVLNHYIPPEEFLGGGEDLVITEDVVRATLDAIDAKRTEVKNQIDAVIQENPKDFAVQLRDAWESTRIHDELIQGAAQIEESYRDQEQRFADLTRCTQNLSTLQSQFSANNDIIAALTALQELHGIFQQAMESHDNHDYARALDSLSMVEDELSNFGDGQGSAVVGQLRAKASQLRSDVIREIDVLWTKMIEVTANKVTIMSSVELAEGRTLSSEELVNLISTIDSPAQKIETTCNQAKEQILRPLFAQPGSFALSTSSNTIQLEPSTTSTSSIDNILDALTTFTAYLTQHLPNVLLPHVTVRLTPDVTRQLLTLLPKHLPPPALANIPEFDRLCDRVVAFEDELQTQGWTKGAELQGFAGREDRGMVWFARRIELILDEVRKLMLTGDKGTEEVEGVESQENVEAAIRESEGAGGEAEEEDDAWGDEWDDEPAAVPASAPAPPAPRPAAVNSNADDDDRWGLDEEVAPLEPPSEEKNADEEEEDPWGDAWDDEPAPHAIAAAATTKQLSLKAAKKQGPLAGASTKPAVGLRETYCITTLPKKLLSHIQHLIDETSALSHQYAGSPVAGAVMSYPTLPSHILALWRALTPESETSAMLRYNDCMYIHEQLHIMSEEDIFPGFNLDEDAEMIKELGQRYYSLELTKQRTTIETTLASVDGFGSAAEPANYAQGKIAIDSVVDLVRKLEGQWKGVLRQSALWQSLGVLVDAAVEKFTAEVQDIIDISEEDSKILVDFATSLASLEDLFIPSTSDSNASTVAFYCEHWLKFRYLAELLEASMADIMYLFKEGALVDFEKDELVRLIEALFADTEVRRRNIGEVRRG